MLLPLWCLGDGTKATWQKGKRNDGMYGVLHSTVVSAGDLAQAMRQSRDTIYYWPATFKDEEFEPSHMECINVGEMIRDSPYDKQTSGGRDLPILRAGTDHRKQAIVRVVCFPGLEVYRQGGGELAKQQLKAEKNAPNEDNAPPDVMRMRRRVTNKYGQEYTGKEGFRTRVLCKSVVLLEWGKQRLLTREAGTSAHIAAVKSGKLDKYEEDSAGSVELWDLFKRDVLDVRRDQQPSPVQRKGSGLFESARQAIAPWLGQAAADREIDEVKARYKEMMDATKQVAQAPRSPQSKKRKARAMEE